jgi:N-acetyl-anhydromuramoyl-L-alanine amidase
VSRGLHWTLRKMAMSMSTEVGPVAPLPQRWQGGWRDGARQVPSPNFGPRPGQATISLVVVHSISLPPGQYGGPEIEQFFTNQLDWAAHPYFQEIEGVEVSAHFVIRRDGSVVQFVSVLDRAWHAGRSSWLGLDNCNDYSVGIELEGLEGEPFEVAQYASLVQLVQDLRSVWPITHIAGHEHVAPGRKQDPGIGFDWNTLKQALNWPAEAFPGASTQA